MPKLTVCSLVKMISEHASCPRVLCLPGRHETFEEPLDRLTWERDVDISTINLQALFQSALNLGQPGDNGTINFGGSPHPFISLGIRHRF